MRPSATLARVALAALFALLAACSRESSAPPSVPAAIRAEKPAALDASAMRERLATRAPALAADAPSLAASFEAFAAWSAARASAPAAKRESPVFLAEGVALARDRRAALKSLIEHDPELALRLALDAPARAALPASFAPLLEKSVAATVGYEVDIACGLPGDDHHSSHASEPEHEDRITRTAILGDTRYRAFVYGRRLAVSTKRALPVHGIAIDDALAVAESPVRRLPADSSSSAIPYLVGETLRHAEDATVLAEM